MKPFVEVRTVLTDITFYTNVDGKNGTYDWVNLKKGEVVVVLSEPFLQKFDKSMSYAPYSVVQVLARGKIGMMFDDGRTCPWSKTLENPRGRILDLHGL
jgi:hypothetical protein